MYICIYIRWKDVSELTVDTTSSSNLSHCRLKRRKSQAKHAQCMVCRSSDLVPSAGAEVDDVMAAVVVSTVHEHGVQGVADWPLLLGLLQELSEVQALGKLIPNKEGVSGA